MSFHIWGVGTALPTYNISQLESAEYGHAVCCQTDDQRRLMSALYRRSGVETRGSVLLESSGVDGSDRQTFYPPAMDLLDRGPTTEARMRRYEEEAAPLAIAAARRALECAALDGAPGITHLVTVSCSGFSAPGFDMALIRELDLSPSTARTHVGFMGCHGALNGLRVAKAFAESDPHARVLVCAVELCSLHHQYGWDSGHIVANSLFADGAGAIVGGAESGGRPLPGRIVAHGSTVIPNSAGAMTWRIGDHGFEMTLSPTVPDLIEQFLGPWLRGWLAQYQLTPDEIGSWAIHPGGPRIITACGQALGLATHHLTHSQQALSELGNMSSPTVLFILERLQQTGAALPCVMLGFGPGMVVEAALVL